MKRIPTALYTSVDEIEAKIEALQFEAIGVPPGTKEHRNITRDIARLRVHAEMKRWLTSSTLRTVH